MRTLFLIALVGCSKALPSEYEPLKTKYLPSAESLAQVSVARCESAEGKHGPNPAVASALESDPNVIDVSVACWANGAITFELGDDPVHGSKLKTWPSDIPAGGYGKKRFMLRGKDNTAPDAEWIDIPDGEPRSKVVTIYSQHPTAKGWVSVQVDVRAPNP